MTAGIYSYLTTGKLPRGASYIRRQLGELRQAFEQGVLDVCGEISLTKALLIQSAIRIEAKVQLAQRYLRLEGESLAVTDRLRLLDAISSGTDQRDRVVARLGLEKSNKSVWDVLDSRPADATPEALEAITNVSPVSSGE